MALKKMSPGMKYKLQLIIIYLSAIVFCILWLSDAIAINKRLKSDELAIQNCAGKAAGFLETYVELGEGDSPLWQTCAEAIKEYSILLAHYTNAARMQKAFRRHNITLKEELLDFNTLKIAQSMCDDFELMEPYTADLAEAFKLLSNDIYSARAIEIIEKIHEETYRM